MSKTQHTIGLIESREMRLSLYANQHNSCPKCGQGCMHTYTSNDVTYEPEIVNNNKAICGCGWEGIVHEMVKETGY